MGVRVVLPTRAAMSGQVGADQAGLHADAELLVAGAAGDRSIVPVAVARSIVERRGRSVRSTMPVEAAAQRCRQRAVEQVADVPSSEARAG